MTTDLSSCNQFRLSFQTRLSYSSTGPNTGFLAAIVFVNIERLCCVWVVQKMPQLAPIFKKAYLTLFVSITFYALALVALTNTWLQRQVLYAHAVQTTWWHDINQPEQFGFAKNQITPFNFTTPDNETLYAWHVMPLGLYAKHELELLKQPSGCAEDITKTKAFQLLRDDPDSRLIINFHGNAGSVSQGWRTDSYRALSDGSTSNIHILAIDYRGFGLSTGSPTEQGIVIDAVAAVNWALEVAKVPSDRIVILGQSLGTAVTVAVAEHFSNLGTDFAGVIMVASFTNIPGLLLNYSIGGYLPLLSPLRPYPALYRLFSKYIIDTWPSMDRLANFVRLDRAGKKVRLFLIHSKDDYEIPWTQTEALFLAAANATTSGGMDVALIEKMKARSTVDMGDGGFVSTWKSAPGHVITEMIVNAGHHSRILTYAPVGLAVLKAFGLDGK